MDLLKKVELLEHAAEEFGLRWENTDQIMEQIRNECEEINEHLHQGLKKSNRDDLQEEIGDLLHAVFSLCVYCEFNPKDTLQKTLSKFERRLNEVKKIAHDHGLSTLEGHSFTELMKIWDKAKKAVG